MFNDSFNPGLEEKLELFKKYGFDYIHWCDNWNDDVLYTDEEMKKFAKLIKDHGLVCQDVHGTATMEYEIDSFDQQA
jgi:sugar phosphate isomerase/epimerase